MIRDNIKKIMDERGLSAADVAGVMSPKTSRGQIYQLINGDRRMTEDWIIKFANALNLEVQSLFSDQYSERRQLDSKTLGAVDQIIKVTFEENGLNCNKAEYYEAVSSLYNMAVEMESKSGSLNIPKLTLEANKMTNQNKA